VTVGEVLRRSTAFLAGRGSETPRLDAELLLGKALEVERIDLYLDHDRPLTPGELDTARALVVRRGRREPVQHVLGEWPFRQLVLTVDGRALIPRPETETLVERCLALIAETDAPRVLDVGVGSGAIALAIADEHAGARVTGIDVSRDALALARENAARTGRDLEVLEHDLFEGLPPGPWDLVVSNPPYVHAAELPGLAPEVADWEPRLALVADGHTESIVRSAVSVLVPGGALVLEAHGEGAGDVAELLVAHGFVDVRVTPDLAGRDRVVEGRLSGAGRGG
jgi:release factor glutamine methyltransferase